MNSLEMEFLRALTSWTTLSEYFKHLFATRTLETISQQENRWQM